MRQAQGCPKARGSSCRRRGLALAGLILAGGLWLAPARARAEEIIFLQDGHTLQADKTEVLGDRIRITRPSGEIIDLPRSDVLSIHDASPPQVSPGPPPAAAYGDITQQMTDAVRQQIQQQKSLAPPPHR